MPQPPWLFRRKGIPPAPPAHRELRRFVTTFLCCEKVISYLLRCSLLQNRDRFAGSRFCFCGRDRPRCSRKKPIRMDGLFGAAARVGEDGAEIRRRSVYTDAASWSRKSWMTSNRWTGSSCWVVQRRARRSTAARSSEKGEMTASVVQQPLCRCWPRSP